MTQNKEKTLKDMHCYGDSDSGYLISIGDVRQNAIKWVKNCENTEDCTTHNMCGFYYDRKKTHKKNRPVFCCCCLRTMEMNNLTVEDIDDTKD